jgi:LytS/YehU family sensor histidine kinase
MNTVEALILNDDEETATEMVQKFSKLMRRVLENSQHPTITMENELETLEHYIRLEQIRFKNHFSYRIERNIDEAVLQSVIPPLTLQPFAENAILHGLRPLHRKGHLAIRVYEMADYIILEIDDDGVGRNPSVQPSDEHHSMGIGITTRRLQVFGEENERSVYVKYLDKKEGGTRVEIGLEKE